MKPKFIEQIEEAFATNQHGTLSFNTVDRYYWKEKKIGPSNLNYFLAGYFIDQGYRVAEYAPAIGLIELNPTENTKDQKSPFGNLAGQQDPIVVLNKIISFMRRRDEKWIFLIQYCEHLAPRESIGVSAATAPGQVHAIELLHRISLDDVILNGQSRVLLITYSELPAELIARANGYRNIRIDLPSFEERLAFIDFMENLPKDQIKRFGELEKGLDKVEFAAISSGMTLISIESLYLESAFKDKPFGREQVKVVKAQAIAQLAQELLEVSEPQIGFSHVAGMKPAKEFLEILVIQIRASHPGVPQTILLQGIPGCGKTHIVQAISNELGWPLVQLRSIRGPYVGQSEQQLEHVIAIIEQLKPVVLLFDEIDQLIGQRGTGASGDSGTSERMIARIFNWLGSMQHRGKILFVGTSNRPDILDAALLDRFRVSIPVLNPTKPDLVELIPLTLNQLDREFVKGTSIEKVAEILAPFRPSGRSLQEILVQAGLITDTDKGKVGSPIDSCHILKASNDYLPIEDPLEMEFIGLTSLSMCSSNSFLPWMSMEGLRPDADIPEELISDEIIDAKTGRLNKSKLHHKLRELAQARQYARAIR